MQVAKYWRNRKLRYRLEGLPRQEERAALVPQPDKVAVREGRMALKREPARLLQ